MSAYIIFIRDHTTDPDAFSRYQQEAPGTAEGHAVTPVVLYGDLETLEGPPAEGVAVTRFADMAAARAWYGSPAYQEVLQHRLKGARYRVLLVEGVDAGAGQ